MAALFFFYQGFSFFYNRKWETPGKPNIGILMFFPYARVIPMHITICLVGGYGENYGGKFVLALFVFLKTMADVIMHIVEKRGFSGKIDAQKRQVIENQTTDS
jgi:hypothetical protein